MIFAPSLTDLVEEDAAAERKRPASAVPHSRRASDKVLIAFHHACETGDIEVAERLLKMVEMMLARPVAVSDRRRRDTDDLIAACERLWHLRHPE